MDQFVSLAGTALYTAGLVALPLFALPFVTLALPGRAAPAARWLSALIDRINGTALGFAMVAAIAIILIQLGAVLLRYVFGLSFSWLNDSIIFSFAMIFMLGAAGTLRDDAHVRVDILRPRFSPRMSAAIELVGAVLFIVPVASVKLEARARAPAES